MDTALESRAIWRALTTVNAPLPTRITAETLMDCLLLRSTDKRWRAHVRCFFQDVGLETIMDMVVEGSVTFDSLSKAISFWDADEDSENARWIREMATVPVAKADGVDAESDRFGETG